MEKIKLAVDFDSTVDAYKFDSDGVTCYYFNPDANSGAQWTEDCYSFELIFDAEKRSRGDTDEFFCHLDSACVRYMTDWYDDGFEDYAHVLEDNLILPRDENTHQLLLNYAKIHTDHILKSPTYMTIPWHFSTKESVFIPTENGVQWIVYEEDTCDGPAFKSCVLTNNDVEGHMYSDRFWEDLKKSVSWHWSEPVLDPDEYGYYAKVFENNQKFPLNDNTKQQIIDYYFKANGSESA